MAEIRIEKQLITDGKIVITTKGADLCQNLELIQNKLKSLETVYRTNGGLQGKIDEILGSLVGLKSDYSNRNKNMLDTLDQIVASYEIEDAQAAVRVNKQDGKAVATMGIAGSGLAAAGFNFGEISTTASGAINKDFVAEKNVHQSAFKEGNYDFEYRPDGAVLVKKDGVALGFTTAENANKVTGGIAYDNWDTNRDHPYAAHNTQQAVINGPNTSLGESGDFHKMNEKATAAGKMTATEQVRHQNSADMAEVLKSSPNPGGVIESLERPPSKATPSDAGIRTLGEAGDFHKMNENATAAGKMTATEQARHQTSVDMVTPLKEARHAEVKQHVDEFLNLQSAPLTPEKNTQFLSDIIKDSMNSD